MQKELITLRVATETKNKLIKEANKNKWTLSFLANQILTEHYEKATNLKQDKHAIVTSKQSSTKGDGSKRRLK